MRGLLPRFAVPALAIGALVIAGCGGATQSGRRIDVEIKDFAFSQTAITLKRGEKVTLAFTNAGTTEHEFMAGRFGSESMGFAQDLFAGLQYQVDPPTSVHGKRHGMAQGGLWAKPGQTATITFVVPDRAGAYEFGCFVAGHYTLGMKGSLTIE